MSSTSNKGDISNDKLEEHNLTNYLPNFLVNKFGNSNKPFPTKHLKPPKQKYFSADIKKIISKQHPITNQNKINVNNNYMIFPEQSYPYYNHFNTSIQFIPTPLENSHSHFNQVQNSSNILKRSFSNPINGPINNNNKTCKKSSLFVNSIKDNDFSSLEEILSSTSISLKEYLLTQKGSRNLQRYLDKITSNELETIINLIKDDLQYIMMDIYGNYFSQKLIQSSSPLQRIQLITFIQKNFVKIACDFSGTHSIQTLIEVKNSPKEEKLLIDIVKDHILELAFDSNGTHVMQKIISTINEENRTIINDFIMQNIDKLINDVNGVCVVKKFINGNTNESIRTFLLDYFDCNCIDIIQSPYGNYAIQHLIEQFGIDKAIKIFEKICDNISSFSMQKFSSNVVEKCVEISEGAHRKKIYTNLFCSSNLSSLIKNKYGNYVLTKAISNMNDSEKKEMKLFLTKRIDLASNKEKLRINSIVDMM